MSLVVERIAVRRGRPAILHDVSLEVRPGEFVCVLGRNGAGKTTLLDTVAGLLRPRSGTVAWEGEDLTAQPVHRLVARGVSYGMEGRRLFRSMSVADNLRLGAGDRSGSRLDEQLERAYALFPVLSERRREVAGALSGGQQQMLVIAQALMCGPRLLLLDEPSAGLAPLLTREVFAALARLREDAGLSLLLVEQTTADALALCDRAYVLDAGRVVLSGSCAEVREDAGVADAYLGRTALSAAASDPHPGGSPCTS